MPNVRHGPSGARARVTANVICVLGMHRSGTSAVAGTLWRLGIELGANLVPGKIGVNDRGFWEHDDVVDINQRLFEALEHSWDDVRPLTEGWWRSGTALRFRDEIVAMLRRNFGAAALWGVKDPRLCRLLPLWLEALRELEIAPRFIHVYRHPVEVAKSLATRDGFVIEKSTLLWLDHNLAGERWSRGFPRVFVGFDRFLAAPEATMERVSRVLGIVWPTPTSLATPEINLFLAPQLRHQSAGDDVGNGSGIDDPLTADTYEALHAAEDGETPQLKIVFDDLYQRLSARRASFDPAIVGHICDLLRRHARLKQRLREMGSSTSWRITRPVRGVERLVQALSKRP